MSVPAPDRWKELSAYLDQALDMLEGERAVWLTGLRRDQPTLAAELESLLLNHEQAESSGFLQSGFSPVLMMSVRAGEQIGAYRLISLVGEGGMGTVWLAERSDGRFQRHVAIKFLSFALSSRAAERFTREGSILARLSHPHIAQLLDAGVTAGGQPYLVLEHVEGEPIDVYCDRQRLSVEARVTLFLDVLSAVAHAHANLIVHRDLKPSNVLVNREGQVKLLDFGIAKFVEDENQLSASTLTREGGMALTPRYAAPEQLSANPITTASDGYSLGVLLYELLTGSHPAGAGPCSTVELVKFIVDCDPPAMRDVVRRLPDASPVAAARDGTPEKLSRMLTGDLEIIVAKALKKDPADRYFSAAAFAEDLKRYLNGQPIAARGDSAFYRVAKFVRRNRAASVLAAVAVLALAAGVIGTVVQARNARMERDFALRELSRANAIDELHWFVLADAAPSGKPFTVDDLLHRAEEIVERQPAKDQRYVQLLISVGRQYITHDDYAKGRPLLEKAYSYAQSLADPVTRADAACGLAQVVATMGDMKRGETLIQQGLAILPEGSPYELQRMECFEHGAEVAIRRGDSRTALSRAQQAQAALHRAPLQSPLMETDVLINLASADNSAGKLRDAVDNFRKAAAELASLGRDDTERAGTVYNNLGVALINMGRPLEAEKALRRSLDISRRGDTYDSADAMSVVNYARALTDLDRTAEAMSYAQSGLESAQHAGNRVAAAQGAMLLSSIHRKQGNFTAAAQDLERVEPVLKGLPPGHIAFAALDSLKALLAQARGDAAGALPFADQAVQIAETAMQRTGTSGSYLALYLSRRSTIEFQLGRTAAAIADASRAISLFPAENAPSLVFGEVYLSLGNAFQAQGKSAEAHAAFQSAATNFEGSLGPDHPSTRDARRLAGL